MPFVLHSRSPRVSSPLPSLTWDYSIRLSYRLSHKHNSVYILLQNLLSLLALQPLTCTAHGPLHVFLHCCGSLWCSTDPGRLMWTYFILRKDEHHCAGGSDNCKMKVWKTLDKKNVSSSIEAEVHITGLVLQFHLNYLRNVSAKQVIMHKKGIRLTRD